MKPAERDRVLSTTNEYLRTVREAIAQTARAVDMGAATAFTDREDTDAFQHAEKAYTKLGEAIEHFVRAIHFYSEIAHTENDDAQVDIARRARSCASFTVGELQHSASHADSAGASMMVKSVYDACALASKAQNVAREAEQTINQ